MSEERTIHINEQMMNDVIAAIDTYSKSVESNYAALQTEISKLGNSFTGSAATGFQSFYTGKIDPLLKENDGTLPEMLKALKSICESIKDQLPGAEGVDEQMKKVNEQ